MNFVKEILKLFLHIILMGILVFIMGVGGACTYIYLNEVHAIAISISLLISILVAVFILSIFMVVLDKMEDLGVI